MCQDFSSPEEGQIISPATNYLPESPVYIPGVTNYELEAED